MHIKHVNEGLYDIDQIAILEDIIECNAALQNWDEVDDEYQYLLWVFEKAYPEPVPARLKAIDEAIGWHLAAYNLSPETLPAQHLITARDLNESAVEVAERLYGKSSHEVASRLYKLLLTEYFIAVGIQRGGPNGAALTDSLLIMNRNPSYYLTSRKLVSKIYLKGLKLLKRIITIYTDNGETESQGMAMVYLADWNLLFNKQRAAFRLYREAYDKLTAGDVDITSIDNYFSEPVLLPLKKFSASPDPDILEYKPVQFTKTSTEPASLEHMKKNPFVTWSDSLPGLVFPAHANMNLQQSTKNSSAYASFTVSKKGLAENIRIIDYRPHNLATRKRAYDMLWSMQFRPRLVTGRAVSSGNYLLHYILSE